MPKLRALIVDDAVVMRRLLAESLGRDPEIEVVGLAANGHIALAMIQQVNPDVITLDIEMPELDGLATLREIRKSHPKLPVIMFSTLTERGGLQTLEALAAGATDYVTKPANVGSIAASVERLDQELIPKIKTHCRRLPLPAPTRTPAPPVTVAPPPPATLPVELVAIGTSTGGPNALAAIFAALATPLPVPVVIVQHMPMVFTRLLAERLDKLGALRCCEGAEGQQLEAGCAYIAPGGRHMTIQRQGVGLRLHLNDGPPENSCRPAVDVLFRSAATATGRQTLGVILTGMGQDGLHGCRTLREQHAQILAQDQASSVVWGMPGYVVEAGLADRVLPLPQVAAEILRRVAAHRRLPAFPLVNLS